MRIKGQPTNPSLHGKCLFKWCMWLETDDG